MAERQAEDGAADVVIRAEKAERGRAYCEAEMQKARDRHVAAEQRLQSLQAAVQAEAKAFRRHAESADKAGDRLAARGHQARHGAYLRAACKRECADRLEALLQAQLEGEQ